MEFLSGLLLFGLGAVSLAVAVLLIVVIIDIIKYGR
jgi:hypothetical protein